MRITLKQTTIVKGRQINEQGVNLALMLPGEQVSGDLSAVTRGYYQGSETIIPAELEDGYEIAENKLGTASIYDKDGNFVTDDAVQAIELGIVRIVALEA